MSNKLSRTETQAVREHMKTCARCREEQESLRNIFLLLDNVKNLESASAKPVNVLAGVRTRINAGRKIRTPWVSLPRLVPYATVSAAILILGFFLLRTPQPDGKEYQIFTEQEERMLLQEIDTDSFTFEELLALSQTSFEEITSNSLLDLPDDAFITASEALTPINENDALTYALATTDPEDVLESLPSEVSEKILENFEKQSPL
ncbi:MAG: hypothetical protein GXO82_03980 [Chlorobi bacterium]|nr:hypothetical protein [Chlorobiota bacterium]